MQHYAPWWTQQPWPAPPVPYPTIQTPRGPSPNGNKVGILGPPPSQFYANKWAQRKTQLRNSNYLEVDLNKVGSVVVVAVALVALVTALASEQSERQCSSAAAADGGLREWLKSKDQRLYLYYCSSFRLQYHKSNCQY
ncbi:hypothetical protein E3N88_16145 [Mikania micrantha]|uniref:Uncharacterized protein n=1 Tax=Mikania micrantha TaxID=192012 RepID=A0A5N6P0P2_9ASTR|nr:hypothetical protein E3N88_16145 [Mikania micrantha]